MRFLHLSDLHLGSRHPELGDRAAAREREVLESFRRAVSFAVDPARGIDAVLITGNLFESHRPESEVVRFVRGHFGQLHAAGIPVFALPGARDGVGYRDSVWREESFPGVTVFTDQDPAGGRACQIGTSTVTLHAAVGRAEASPTKFGGFTRGTEPGLHIGLLCAPLHGSDEFEVRPRVWHVHDKDIAAYGLDYVALGGMHAFNAVVSGGRTFGAWPGTLEGRRFEAGDFGPKSLLVVEINQGGKVRLERHSWSERRLEMWTIDLAAEAILEQRDLEAALLARAQSDLIAQVSLKGKASFLPDVSALLSAVQDHFFHLEIHDESDLEGGPLVRRIETEKTIRGVYVRRLVRRMQELRARVEQPHAPESLRRELKVVRLALRLGLEQFLEAGRARGSSAERHKTPAFASPPKRQREAEA